MERARAVATATELGAVFEYLRSDIQYLRSDSQDLRSDIQELRSDIQDLRSDIQDLRSDIQYLRSDIQDVQFSAASEIDELRFETARVAESVSGLETLRTEIDRLRTALRGGSGKSDSSSDRDRTPSSLATVPPVQLQTITKPSAALPAEKQQSGLEIPMKEAESLDGIIAYLTKKYHGNVHYRKIVTISSKSDTRDYEYRVQNAADLSSSRAFDSVDEPEQWVCWDFREMRVRLTHYTIATWFLKSWVIEGSLDGTSWTALDRQTDTQHFKLVTLSHASFALSRPAEFRFIRLTQTGKRHDGRDVLALKAVEFFGTLSQ
jgi:prefoldin subunit 5